MMVISNTLVTPVVPFTCQGLLFPDISGDDKLFFILHSQDQSINTFFKGHQVVLNVFKRWSLEKGSVQSDSPSNFPEADFMNQIEGT